MFSFLYPLMWLALPLIAVPLYLHLQRRNDSRTVRFSAMQFLDDQPLARRRPLLPRDVPLLLLRLLLLLLVIASFAWPFVRGADDVLVQESIVYVLDNTLSNQALSNQALSNQALSNQALSNRGAGRRIDESRESVAEALEAAGLDTQVAVIELSDEPRVLVRFGDDPREAARRVRELPAGYRRGSYAAAVRQARSLLEDALGQRRRIVLVSDSQQNQWLDDAAIPPFLGATEVDLPVPQTESLPNVSAGQPFVQRIVDGRESIVRCSVRVSRFGATGEAEVIARVNGRELVRETIELNPNGDQRTVLFDLPDEPTEWLHGELEIQADGDALDADNRAYFSLSPVKIGRVDLLADSIYLRTALSQDVIAGRWAVQVLSPSRLVPSRPADVLVVESKFLTGQPVRDLVQEYLKSGRGVALIANRTEPGSAASGFLRDFGIEWVSEQRPEAAPFQYVFLEHPLFQAFRGATGATLADVTIQGYRQLELNQGAALAYAATGDPVLVESTVGRGRLLVFAFELDRADTNWPLHPTFLPFLDGCLKHLQRPDEQAVTDYLPGETGVWNLPVDELGRDTGDLQVAVRRFGEATDTTQVPVEDGRVRFPLPDQPGNYDLRVIDNRGTRGDSDRPIELVLSVNPPAEESRLTFVAGSDTLEGWRGEPTGETAAPAESPALSELSRQEILRQDLWWWLLAVGALALLAETVWIARAPGNQTGSNQTGLAGTHARRRR